MSNILESYRNNPVNLIKFYCFSSKLDINFDAFITNFTDGVTPSWTPHEVYSRMDPLYVYKSTKRKISISFDVPAYDLGEAVKNYENIQNLMDSLYPSFNDEEKKRGAAIVNGPPLIQVYCSDLIFDKSATSDGLLAIINNITFKPELASGVFVAQLNDEQYIFPKLFKLNVSFDVVHKITNDDITDTGAYLKYDKKKVIKQDNNINKPSNNTNAAKRGNKVVPGGGGK